MNDLNNMDQKRIWNQAFFRWDKKLSTIWNYGFRFRTYFKWSAI